MMNRKYPKETLTMIYLGKNISVSKSSDKSKENICGIVLKETKNMFFIKTNNDVKKIPKKECLFKIENYEIEGKDICYTLADRIKKYA